MISQQKDNMSLIKENVKWAPVPNSLYLHKNTGGSKDFSQIPNPITSGFVFITRFNPHTQKTEILLVDVLKRGWDVPGGHKEAGEDIRDAIIRETAEEAGLSLSYDDLTLIGWVNLFITGAKPRHYAYPYPDTYLAFAHASVSYDTIVNGTTLPDEIGGYEWVTLDEITEKVKKKFLWTQVVHLLSVLDLEKDVLN